MGHFIKKCGMCKKVITQCRCMSCDKSVTYGICESCLDENYKISEEKTISDYFELIMAVGNKYPGESRHETALRYIREAETNQIGGNHAKQEENRKENNRSQDTEENDCKKDS